MTSIAGKKVLVMGSSGYVGNAFLKKASKLGLNVVAVSRRGKLDHNPNDPLITYVKGDALDQDSYKEHLYETDAVFHTIGTLLDTTITGSKKPGDTGKTRNF